MNSKHLQVSVSVWKPKSIQVVLTILLLNMCIVLGAEDWVPFTSQAQQSVTFDQMQLDKKVAMSEFSLTLNFPGVTLDYPDNDGLLGGKYALLSFIQPEKALIDVHHMDAACEVEKAGKPDLPFIRFQVRIPSWVNFDDVRVTAQPANYEMLHESYDIAPVQEQVPDSFDDGIYRDNRVFQKDAKLYATNEIFEYPIEYQKNIMHGIKFVEIFYSPLRYNPVTKKVYKTNSVTMTVSFTGQQQRPEENTSVLFENVVSGAMFNAVTGEIGEQKPSPRGGSYFVVTGSKFTDSKVLKDFVAYRKSQNYSLVDIYEGKATSDITAKIKEVYKAKKFEYLIIIGDETVIKPPDAGSGKTKFSYKKWATLDGSDNVEDVMLGIFLCGDEKAFQNIVNHQKNQEKGGSWSKTVLTTAGSVKAPTWSKYSTAHAYTVHLDDPSKNLGFTVNRVYHGAKPTHYGSWQSIPKTKFESWALKVNPFYTNGTQATAACEKYWNEGASVMSHRDHGSTSGPSGPRMNGKFVAKIKSESSPFFLSINCLSGAFVNNHSSNFSYQSQVREAGTCATLAASVSTSTTVNCKFMAAMYTAMCPKEGASIKNVGKVYLKGMLKNNSANRKYYHLYGDPMTNLSLGGGITSNKDIVNKIGQDNVFTVQYTNSHLLYQSQTDGFVSIKLYSLQGKLIRTIANSVIKAGSHTLPLMSTKQLMASGMYFAKIQTPVANKTIKLLIKD